MLGKQFDVKSNHAEDVREFYRQQGRDEMYLKIRSAFNDVTDLNVLAYMHMILNSLFDDEEDKNV